MFKYKHRLPQSLIKLPISIIRGIFNKISVSSQENVNAAAHIVLTKIERVFLFLPCLLPSPQKTPFLLFLAIPLRFTFYDIVTIEVFKAPLLVDFFKHLLFPY